MTNPAAYSISAQGISIEIVTFAQREAEIRHVRSSVFVIEQSIPESLEWDDHEHSSWHALATENGNPIATGRLQTDGKITRIAVLEPWRRKGIANAILLRLLAVASENNLHTLYLNAQSTAVSLYEKHGFTCSGKPFDEGGIEHIRMERL